MSCKNVLTGLSLLYLYAFSYLGCTPTSYTLRYKDYSDIKTHEDSVKAGLVKEESDDLIYYSQVQDTSVDFQDWELEEEDTIITDSGVDISTFLTELNVKQDKDDSELTGSTPKERMLIEIIKYLNTPYKFGGNSSEGIDCSAFTQNVYSQSVDIILNRSAKEQYTQGVIINEQEDLVFGDLVFFNTRRRTRPGHVGIYIGNRLFAHASSAKGVIVSSLDHKYYAKRYMGARRIDDIFLEN
ncbi:MAG: C40 family peptidase [Ignavibacteriaceae bacterium]|nr:C40 family peptidase [Ignavibacteriaceae bacterium]